MVVNRDAFARNGDTRFLNILNLDNGIVHAGEITVDIDHKVNIPAGETDMCHIGELDWISAETDQNNFYDETAFMDSATTIHRHSILESTMRLPVFESGQQLIPPEYSHRKSCTSAHLPLDKFVLEYVKAEFEVVDTENLHLKLDVVESLQGGWNGYCVLEGENDRDGRIEDAELFCGSDSKQDHHTEKEGHHIQRHGLSTTDGFKENKDTVQKILSSIIDGLECSKQEDFRLDGSGNVMAEERKKTLTMESQFSDDGKTFVPSDTTILRGPLTDPGSCLSETKDNMAAPESRSISMESMNNRNSQECAPEVFAAVEQESSFEKGSCSSYTMEAASHDINLLEPSISQQLVLNESPNLNKNDIVDVPALLLNVEGSLSLRIGQRNEIIVNEETADFNNSITESREDSLVGSSMGLQPLDNVSDIESNFQETLLQPGSLSEAENRESNSEDLIGYQIQDEGEGTSLGSSSYYVLSSANRQSSSSSSSNDWDSSESDSSTDLESSAESDSDADSESS